MSRQSRVDWSFGPGHGPISGVINAAGSTVAGSMVGDLAGVSPPWGLTAGAAMAAAATISSRLNGDPGQAVAYRVACWLGAGGWSTWALAAGSGEPFAGPWSTSGLASLAVGSLAAGAIGWALSRADRKEQAKALAAVVEAQIAQQRAAAQTGGDHDTIAAAWQAEIRRQSRKNIEVVAVEFWQPNTGFTLDVQLPADGTTIDDIKPYEKALATAMDVPPGCAVEVTDPGIGRRVVHIRVGTVDAFTEDHHLPAGCEPDSIENDLSMGIHSNRTEATVNVRYNCVVLVGQTDSGKSNQLNVLTRQIVRCTDALVWAIDLTGNGRYPRPWVRAWHEGRADVPAIDWIAPDPQEATLICAAALEIIKYRTADYEQLLFQNGWDKIMVSPEIPEIVIMVDEFGGLSEGVKEMLRQISDTGRGAGVRVVSCALEATGAYIPRAMITQSRERIGMRVQDETQLQYLFDTTWRSGRFDMSTMRVKGSGLISSDAAPPEKFKGWRIEPARIDTESIAVAPWRPQLDELSAYRADNVTIKVVDPSRGRTDVGLTGVYTGRWDRTRSIVFPQAPAGVSAPKPRRPSENGSTVAVAAPAGQGDGGGLASSDESLTEKLAAARRAAEEAERPSRGAGEADLPPLPDGAEPDWSVVESWLRPGESTTDAAGKPKPHPRLRMRQLVWDARQAGVGPGPVHENLQAEGYETAYQTVNEWMRKDAAEGVLAQPGGKKTPYFPGPKLTNPYEG